MPSPLACTLNLRARGR